MLRPIDSSNRSDLPTAQPCCSDHRRRRTTLVHAIQASAHQELLRRPSPKRLFRRPCFAVNNSTYVYPVRHETDSGDFYQEASNGCRSNGLPSSVRAWEIQARLTHPTSSLVTARVVFAAQPSAYDSHSSQQSTLIHRSIQFLKLPNSPLKIEPPPPPPPLPPCRRASVRIHSSRKFLSFSLFPSTTFVSTCASPASKLSRVGTEVIM